LFEEQTIQVLAGDSLVRGVLKLYDAAPDDENQVMIQLSVNHETLMSINESYFEALQDLRLELEKRKLQLICNGSAKNIYPSPMMLGMGTGRQAYQLTFGLPAKLSAVVDIFDVDMSLEFVSVLEQKQYYHEWIKRLMR
jgi:hypothetical protein